MTDTWPPDSVVEAAAKAIVAHTDQHPGIWQSSVIQAQARAALSVCAEEIQRLRDENFDLNEKWVNEMTRAEKKAMRLEKAQAELARLSQRPNEGITQVAAEAGRQIADRDAELAGLSASLDSLSQDYVRVMTERDRAVELAAGHELNWQRAEAERARTHKMANELLDGTVELRQRAETAERERDHAHAERDALRAEVSRLLRAQTAEARCEAPAEDHLIRRGGYPSSLVIEEWKPGDRVIYVGPMQLSGARGVGTIQPRENAALAPGQYRVWFDNGLRTWLSGEHLRTAPVPQPVSEPAGEPCAVCGEECERGPGCPDTDPDDVCEQRGYHLTAKDTRVCGTCGYRVPDEWEPDEPATVSKSQDIGTPGEPEAPGEGTT